MNRRSPRAAEVQPRESGSKQLLRGPKRDLDHEGDTRHWVERVVPGVDRDARVAEKIRIAGHAVHDIRVDVEHLPARVVRILRPGRTHVPGRDIDICMVGPKGAAAADEVAAAGDLGVTPNRPASYAARGEGGLPPSPLTA
jgi:hypothetical protein